ncbi:rho guanine nucleotide exchange factor 33 isoform X1, putative [Babesia ovata]|uniref:Rho guanine nucleotide exchange factor 33 isoform X1, putative n=1 Tax=Babesia ovata TaxID=189622 RepID=A0A2H6KKC1_9APIC|nr:rho guanine nucleotide exchange factor 33 isoform X1, putative [Babesia ovata]GBE63445.1 rho guanine nucleotide exchange factor 33 isoform X1, putative [Babesia ovata]
MQATVNEIISGELGDNKSNLTKIKETLAALQTKQNDGDVKAGAPGGKSTLEKKAAELESQIGTFLSKNVGDTDDKAGTVYNDLKTLQENIRTLSTKVVAVRTMQERLKRKLPRAWLPTS